MKLHRFIGNFNIALGKIRIENVELFNQVRNVLKMKTGEEIILCDGNLHEGKAILREFQKNGLVFEIIDVFQNDKESKREVTLFCAVLKKENFELVCQKVTEIGVTQIVPIITNRTVKLGFQKERLEKIIREASEQSGRGRVPILASPVNFTQALDMAKLLEDNIFLSPRGDFFQRVFSQKIGLWIGPEGGWSATEEKLAQEYNFRVFNISPRILRGETAAIIGTYLVIAEI